MDVNGLIAHWPVGSAAVAVVTPDGVVEAVNTGTSYPWASVTKIVSALTFLDAVGEGELGLDEPAGPPGSTVRHLLSHTSGLPFEAGGPGAAVGSRRLYSNEGFDVLAGLLTERTGQSFEEAARERILEPLGMTHSSIRGSAAKDGAGPVADLAVLAGELLSPQLLDPETVRAASTISFPGLDGILPGFGRQSPNDWGLGFEIRDHKSPHWTSERNSPATFGHFGQSGSFLWVDPIARVACVSLCDRAFGPWAAKAWPVLSTAVLQTYGS